MEHTFSAVLLPVDDQPRAVHLLQSDSYMEQVLQQLEHPAPEHLSVEFLKRKYNGPMLYYIHTRHHGGRALNSQATKLAGYDIHGPALLLHLERESGATRYLDLTLDHHSALLAEATELRFTFLRSYWASLRALAVPVAEWPDEFPAFKDTKQWCGKTPCALVNEFVQGNKQLRVDYEQVSTTQAGPYKMRLRVLHQDEELSFVPDEYCTRLQDAKQRAALEFVRWLSHYQLTGEKMPLAASETSEAAHSDDEGEQLTAPEFAYFDFVKAMAAQFQLEHEAEVWQQAAASDRLVLKGRVIEDVLGDLTLMKMTLEPGSALVEDAKAYRVHYVGKLSDESVFDSTFAAHRAATIPVGEGIDLMAVGLRSMRVGEKALLWGTPERCFKELGSPPRIPPHAHCLFYLHLISVKTAKTTLAPESAREDEVLTPHECVARASALKAEGNVLYQRQQFAAALSYYSQGLKVLQLNKAQLSALEATLRAQYADLAAVLHYNSAAVYLALESWDKVLRHCSMCLEREPHHIKALIRRSRAHTARGEFEQAQRDLRAARAGLEQSADSALRNAYQLAARELAQREEAHRVREAQMCRNMFARNS